VDLPIQLERAGSVSLPRQLTIQFRQAILDGRLPAGTRLPSTRSLAAELGISRNVALAAFDDLFAEGYVEGHHGSGTYVARDLPLLPRPAMPSPPGTPRWLHQAPPPPLAIDRTHPDAIEFRLGKPAVRTVPPDVWRRIWSDIGALPPPADYGAPAGDADLRVAIAGYLGRARGVACAPDDIVITSGALQSLDLIARSTLIPGDRVAFEEPGYPVARQALIGRGAEIVPVSVDDDGLRVDALPDGDAAPLMVYVTPSHQYPLGARLPVPRRMALLEWARNNDALVVEDDYDSEFRFDAPPLPALAGLDGAGRVAYIGTFSKVLSPALRVGYLVAPPPLRTRVVQFKRLTDFHTPWPVQRALATFIQGGHLERHIRRMRREYAEKRSILRATLEPVADLANLIGLEAGLHAFLELRTDIDPARVATDALARGVAVSTLDGYYHAGADRNGLLLGYGGLEVHEVQTGAAILSQVIREVGNHPLPVTSRRAPGVVAGG